MNESKIMPHDHGSGIHVALHLLPEQEEFNTTAEAFKQLSDATRLKIFWLLCHSEECVSNISVAVDMSAPAVSHHLRFLKQAGLISSRREGKEVYYTLAATERSEIVHRIVDEMFRIHCPGKEGHHHDHAE